MVFLCANSERTTQRIDCRLQNIYGRKLFYNATKQTTKTKKKRNQKEKQKQKDGTHALNDDHKQLKNKSKSK